MKVTRLKKGYRINLSDAEWAVLTRTMDEGMDAVDWVEGGWPQDHIPPDEKRIMTEAETGKRPWMVVTDDRRSA